MHKIFIENRCLAICQETGSDLDAIRGQGFATLGSDCPGLFAEEFKTGAVPSHVCLAVKDEEYAYKAVCSRFKEVNAAGGLVRGPEDRVLMIRRNGLWDLPKGHQEGGEDIEVTAVREVMEETGLSDLEVSGLICITDHCYVREGTWHLKHTWWYSMHSDQESGLAPQTEEGISEAVWIGKDNVGDCLKETYPSIVEVFEAKG